MITKEMLDKLYFLGFRNGMAAMEDIEMKRLKANYEARWFGAGLSQPYAYVSPDFEDLRASAEKVIEELLGEQIPAEPTEEMLACGENAGWHGGIEGDKTCERDAAEWLYKRMVEASTKGFA